MVNLSAGFAYTKGEFCLGFRDFSCCGVLFCFSASWSACFLLKKELLCINSVGTEAFCLVENYQAQSLARVN